MRFVESRPERCGSRAVNPPGAEREPVHIHPRQTSGAEVTARLAGLRGRRARASADGGAVDHVPPGAPHRFWNDGEEDAAGGAVLRTRPRQRRVLRDPLCPRRRGGARREGDAEASALALMVPEFGKEIRPVSLPWPVLRALAALLSPVARARGYRARLPCPRGRPARPRGRRAATRRCDGPRRARRRRSRARRSR